ncbi:MAG: hypothetical protein QXY55_05805 [Candidatus Korarchaeota archaeon]
MILEIMLEILSPTIITERRSLRGFLKTLDYIPASTLRGAILSELYRNGIVGDDFLKSERDKPSVIASYAYPVTSDGKKCYPSHPFMYRCKVCGQYENYLDKIIEDLERDGDLERYGELRKLIGITCRNGHAALENLYSKYYPSETCKVSASRFICTGVNKRRGSSETGMLYEYEAITPGRKFWATLTIPDEIEKYIDGLEIRIGRGISRGFGISKIVKSKVISLREAAMKIEEALTHGRYLVLFGSSPLVSCHEKSYTPYPSSIDLSNIAAISALGEKGKLVIKTVYGKADFRIGGWDMHRNVEKVSVKFATRPGAIVIAEYYGTPLALAALSLLGTVERLGDTLITGVNMLHPVRSHPIFTLGGK